MLNVRPPQFKDGGLLRKALNSSCSTALSRCCRLKILEMATPVNITSYFNRGSLTTIFTPPTTCLQTLSTAVYEVNGIPQTTTYYGHWFDGPGQTCYPTGTMPTSLLLSPTYWGTYWCMLTCLQGNASMNLQTVKYRFSRIVLPQWMGHSGPIIRMMEGD
jgi:hypothetical protein